MKVKFVILLSLINISIATETDLEWRGRKVCLKWTESEVCLNTTEAVMSLNDVKKECKTRGAYLFLDYDETIYTHDTVLTFDDWWCEDYKDELERIMGPSMTEIICSIDKRINSFVREMLARGNVLILTARRTPPTSELKAMGLDFPSEKIIATDEENKGNFLVDYFTKNKINPGKIVFMDDQIRRLQEVARALRMWNDQKTVKTDYIGYECTYSTGKMMLGLRGPGGYYQKEYYKKNHIWLHDFNVRIHMYAKELWEKKHTSEIPAELDKRINYVCCNSYSDSYDQEKDNLFGHIKKKIEGIINNWKGDEKAPADSRAVLEITVREITVHETIIHANDEDDFFDIDSENGD